MKTCGTEKGKSYVETCGKYEYAARRSAPENGNRIRFDFFRNAVKLCHVVRARGRKFVICGDKNLSSFFGISKSAVAFFGIESGRNAGEEEIGLFARHKREFVFHFRNRNNRFITFSVKNMQKNGSEQYYEQYGDENGNGKVFRYRIDDNGKENRSEYIG